MIEFVLRSLVFLLVVAALVASILVERRDHHR
jgi:hypothetical protein